MKTENKTSVLLPIRENTTLDLPHFPTRMQAVVFRAWEMVPAERIAKVLQTSEKIVCEMASDMGLPPQKNTELWMKRGYITIIKAMWHLLPYEQLLQLLDWDEERLAYTLKEDDVLYVKMGFFKPECEPVLYRPLSLQEKERTRQIRTVLEGQTRKKIAGEKLPFDFVDPIYSNARRMTADVEKYDIFLGQEWSVNYPESCREVLTAVEIFCEDFYEDWGIRLGRQRSSERSIQIYIVDREQEYHKVVIKRDGIEIFAAKSGVLRALIMLLDKARVAGGPCYREGTFERSALFHTRFLYSYCGLYGQVFDEPPEVSYPEKMLRAYAKAGINGIWTQAVLYKLVEFPFEPSISEGWQKRLENLKQMVSMAGKYGIKVYLYLNEPRSMPLSFFEKYPDMKGQVQGDYACICTSSERGRKYLSDAISRLCREVKDLGGFFTICRGENLTHCYSKVGSVDSSDPSDEINCPRCAKRKAHEVVAEVDQIITQAAKSVNPDIQIISWTWSWTGPDFTPEAVEEGIKMLPRENAVMAVSEDDKELCIGGVRNVVRDYSMAHIGPSPTTKRIWEIARESHHETFAKLQINTTWECSPVPSLPVYQLVIDHVENVKKEKVNGLMLSWTLGGYPSANLKVASGSFFHNLNGEEEKPYEEMLRSIYGEDYEVVKRATDYFCQGFQEFPFNHWTLYFAPHNAGVSNLLYEKPSGYQATMTCYCYDDLDGWRVNYPADVFEEQYRKICEKWEQGLELIEDMEDSEFKDVSVAGYSLFKSTYNQICFIRARDRYLRQEETDAMEKVMYKIARDERKLAERVYEIMRRNPTIGYEAANHYYFSQNMILEKMINCAYLMEKYGRETEGVSYEQF